MPNPLDLNDIPNFSPSSNSSPSLKLHPTLTPSSTISSLSFPSPLDIDIDQDVSESSTSMDPLGSLVELMNALPPEILQQIWSNVISHPSASLRLSVLRTCKSNYRKIVPQLYKHVVLTSHSCRSYFYGLGPTFHGPTAEESSRIWPVSGPGIMPLRSIGLSYDPSISTSPFIRRFTLCNLVESVVISDIESMMVLLEAGSETWRNGMDTWRSRVLFDQIDSITFLSPIFRALDQRPLVYRGLLREVWNCIKSDSVIIHFPDHPSPVSGNYYQEEREDAVSKEDTYRIALDILGSPKSLGQENRLLAELVIYTPQLDGIDLSRVGASRVKVVLIGRNNWIACGTSDNGREKGDMNGHKECLSQEAQLRRFVRRHWLVGIDNDEYIGIPQEVENVSIYNVANYNRRRCVTGRISSTNNNNDHMQNNGVGVIIEDESSSTISLPTILYSALEGDEQLAREVDGTVKFLGME
ncbi:uncharacterized protein L199_007799 [Kwoniella botswanensis]|uniref:uncharacterized protein n=1 Tax=Kwoniella botswanensis TaxID=1268659 RepID=UPI00315D807F